MTKEEINKGLRDLDSLNPELRPVNFQDLTKTIPFHGFVYRDINFDKLIWLGKSPYTMDNEQPINQWIGFCPGLLHAYNRWQTTEEESGVIRQLCEQLVIQKTVVQANMLFDYLQLLGETRDKQLLMDNEVGI